LLDLGLGPLF